MCNLLDKCAEILQRLKKFCKVLPSSIRSAQDKLFEARVHSLKPSDEWRGRPRGRVWVVIMEASKILNHRRFDIGKEEKRRKIGD
jgi:hypothetical protein